MYSRQQLQYHRIRAGMSRPLVPRVVRSACLTEPLINGESTAKVPEACHPFVSVGTNQALQFPCTRISSQSAEICDRSAHLGSQRGTYSRRRFCDVFPLSPGDPHMILWQALTADSESPWSLSDPDSRGSTLVRQGAIVGHIQFHSLPVLMSLSQVTED
jgi:hypothetical protein